jgi:tryptophan synthase alpha chain
MSVIRKRIEQVNQRGGLALSVFLTAGFPSLKGFDEAALRILDAGADMLEIGMPFSDPIADGPVIQQSSHIALQNGVTMASVFRSVRRIREYSDRPLILMGYANPLLQFGLQRFLKEAAGSGADGLIIPDIPLDEDRGFWSSERAALDRILLTTPTSSEKRIREIDKESQGFVYCVSVTGITGTRNGFSEEILSNLRRTRNLVTQNKMLIGFGISGPDAVRQLKPFCDGVIVGSAIVRKLMNSPAGLADAIDLVSSLRQASD